MIIGIDISVLNDPQRSGVAVYVYQLVDALLKINKQDKFILFGLSPYAAFENLYNLDFKKYPNVEMKLYKMPARLFRLIFLIWQKINWPPIENFIGEVDIFHSFNWYLPPQKKGKVVATVFDMTPFLYPQFHLKKTIQLDSIRLNRVKKEADLVITISENSKKDFLRFAPKKKVEVIYPGVSTQFEGKRVKGKGERILEEYGLEKGYILSVGTLEPRKNIKRLIEAYLQSGVEQKLVLVGSWGWKNDELLQLTAKNADKIITTGYIPDEDLHYIYSQALLFIYPSLYEGFGIPVLEAMAAGVPVITSKTSSLPEVGGKAVYYIDPLNVQDIKIALIKVVKNEQSSRLRAKNVRDELIKKGFKQAEKFSWEKSAKKLKSLYQQL